MKDHMGREWAGDFEVQQRLIASIGDNIRAFHPVDRMATYMSLMCSLIHELADSREDALNALARCHEDMRDGLQFAYDNPITETKN